MCCLETSIIMTQIPGHDPTSAYIYLEAESHPILLRYDNYVSQFERCAVSSGSARQIRHRDHLYNGRRSPL